MIGAVVSDAPASYLFTQARSFQIPLTQWKTKNLSGAVFDKTHFGDSGFL